MQTTGMDRRYGNSFLRAAANLIVEQLAQVNISVETEFPDAEAFKTALGEGKYDFYLSEIKLAPNMDLSPFFSDAGAAAYGLEMEDLRTNATYQLYLSGQAELSEFLEAFSAELPFIPLLFRNGQFCYSQRIGGKVEVTEMNLFRSMSEWQVQ